LLLIEALKVAAKLWAEPSDEPPQVVINFYGADKPLLLTSQAEKGANAFEGLVMPLYK
jgi:hypothetical protein